MPKSVRRLGPIFTSIWTAEHIQGWCRQRERTGSVRTDLGFADHIAATYHQGMAEIDRLLRQIPYTAGFSPIAYQQISDFAILKKSGVFDVELVRTIQLMVASFNMNNKHTGRTVMTRAEQLRLIPPKQSGSRKKKRSKTRCSTPFLPWTFHVCVDFSWLSTAMTPNLVMTGLCYGSTLPYVFNAWVWLPPQ
jgi:hypothetical protein